jgi:hypothetical protein
LVFPLSARCRRPTLERITKNRHSGRRGSVALASSPSSTSSRAIAESAARTTSDRTFAGVLTASFFVLATLGALHHEMWRDELHGWLLTRDNTNLWNVFQATRYEAHFVLWRVFLFGITRWTHNPLALQFWNLLLATTTVWIVARFSPFNRLEKCLLSFGYYFFYEYCIVAQDYTMIALLMVSFCALYRHRVQHPLALSAVLFLLANTLPYGFVIALIFSALLAFDWASNHKAQSLRTAPHLGAGALIVLAGLVCAALQLLLIRIGPNTSWKHPLTSTGFADAIVNIWRAYVPISKGFPNPRRWLWGINFIDSIAADPSVKVTLSLLLVLVSASLLLKRPTALFLYLVGVASLLSIQFVVNIGALRHKGFLFMLFVGALWIGSNSPERPLSSASLQRWGDFFGRWRNVLVAGLLAIQVVAGLYAFGADWLCPFSGSKEAAQFLRDSGLSKLPIVGAPEARVAPLSAHLDKPIYYPESSRFGTYADLRRSIAEPSEPPTEQVVGEAFQLALQWHSNVVVALGYPVGTFPAAGVRLDSGRASDPSATLTIVKECHSLVDEPYTLFLIRLD